MILEVFAYLGAALMAVVLVAGAIAVLHLARWGQDIDRREP